MKKLIVLSLVLVMSMSLTLSATTVSATEPPCDGEVCTELTRGVSGGTGPIIKAKWEMLRQGNWHGTGTILDPYRLDDFTAAGAQFTPPNVWGANMDYAVCAIVTDPNGVADIDGVYVDIYYPQGIAFHYAYPANTSYNGKPMVADVINGSSQDKGVHGCGEFIEENELLPLPKMDGYNLFCGTIRNDNSNLPKFFPMDPDTTLYNYDEICGATGELMKETAKVYCDDKDLTWEDPAGNYRVEVFAQDKAGNFSYLSQDKSDIDYNEFTYLEAQGYDIDFTAIDYGEVALNSHKIISGDLTWGNNVPSIRNTGNVRLYISINQDDMGLGKVGTTWNVKYDARIGNEQLDWKWYWPEVNTKLEDILDLSEIEEMDFSVLITKFPSISATYTGVIDLSATRAVFRGCIAD
ncbi:hypothetical protein L6279_05125 [Candidatus Parcubacteria bacterium]|nr:hypothetical protein [Candidatus Parcubacteria bacterium]